LGLALGFALGVKGLGGVLSIRARTASRELSGAFVMAESKSPFRPSFLKIERAQRHISELEGLANGYLNNEPVTASFQMLAPEDRPEGLPAAFIVGWRISMQVKEMPETISPIIGDIFHNLRSALDLMASELARQNGKTPDDVYFPFAGTEAELDYWIDKRNFSRAGEAAIKLLKEFKPYKGGNLELRAIHDLNVRDKHQELIVQRPLSTVSGPILDTRPEDGSGLRVVPNSVSTSIQLIFPADCALAEMELIGTLKKLVEITAGIVKAFEALRAPSS
jgi:hypothetical protein